ncbi:unnamed protein product [Nesidiocoris tenuis]|uniref:Secreted protein n=1 Tax=Nesidiocoris tenuis TaxID=355587 RepID=A0A6H5GZY0_9HEMI|nr:unnamed protein product [Nesidiocoris tenuis]
MSLAALCLCCEILISISYVFQTTFVRAKISNGSRVKIPFGLEDLESIRCLWARMRPMRAMLAEMPREPRVKMTRASVSPPGWHWKTREPFRVKFPAAPLPYRRFAPIIATAEPGKNTESS